MLKGKKEKIFMQNIRIIKNNNANYQLFLTRLGNCKKKKKQTNYSCIQCLFKPIIVSMTTITS